MKYKRPEMGYVRTGVIKNSRVYLLGTLMLWDRKGCKTLHTREPYTFCPANRKGSREVYRFRDYMMFEGMRKPMKRK